LGAEAVLLLTAAIWGFAFAAQRAGMDHVGPFLFNGIRFALGGLALLPFVIAARTRKADRGEDRPSRPPRWHYLILGAVLFGGASLQQVGIVYTTAGKAGFITGLYVVLVPILGLRVQRRPSRETWAGAGLAVTGLFLLSVREDLSMQGGDLLILACAFFWAAHILLVDRMARLRPWAALAAAQFAICAVASLVVALCFEEISTPSISAAWVPLVYAGILSVGVGYSLQIVAQRRAAPAPAAIIMSLEAVFAALGGWLLLGEVLDGRELAGCGLMLGGMAVSQIRLRRPR
jgi:drug/metabolite transporter (DMT)-like permease